MKKPREDGTNKNRISGTKELLYQVLEIGHNGLTEIENEIIIGVLLDNLSFTEIGIKKQLTRTRIKQIYGKAIKRLANRLKLSLNWLKENAELRKQVMELEKKVSEQSLIIKTHNEIADILNNLPEETLQLLNTDISKTSLSVRGKNALRLLDIITVDDLVRCGPSDVMNKRNVGKRTFEEIESFLTNNYLKWNMFR